MSDDTLRQAEQRLAASPDDSQAAAAFLAARLRTGHQLSPDQLLRDRVRSQRYETFLIATNTHLTIEQRGRLLYAMGHDPSRIETLLVWRQDRVPLHPRSEERLFSWSTGPITDRDLLEALDGRTPTLPFDRAENSAVLGGLSTDSGAVSTIDGDLSSVYVGLSAPAGMVSTSNIIALRAALSAPMRITPDVRAVDLEAEDE